MQLFLDTTDTAVLADLAKTGLVDGVTTNPTLIAKSGRPMLEVIKEIAGLVDGPVSAEAVATDAETMIKEGEKLAANGIMTNVTLCFSANQALLAAKSGATFISPFVGRLDDHGAVGMDLIQEIRTVYDNYEFDTEILVASARTTDHVKTAALYGADCVTLPPQVFKDLVKHPLTDRGLEAFLADWAKTGQSIL